MSSKMKFWELVSIFRSEVFLLEQTLQQSKWRKYQDNYLNLEELVYKQDRKVLDEEIPQDLVMEICSKSNIKFWFYKSLTPPVLSSYEFAHASLVDKLNAEDTFLRFGGSKMEEALEKSYTEIINS